MAFNSFDFIAFLALVLALYAVLRHEWQNRLLLAASFVFYAAWDIRFPLFLLFSIGAAYFCGLRMGEARGEDDRRFYLACGISAHLALLAAFKYFGFFAPALQAVSGRFGLAVNPDSFALLLPVGLSFYAFRSMGYLIDVYNRALAPEPRFSRFALFVAYFPQLVSGPIERAGTLLPQINAPRKIDAAGMRLGCYIIAWGLFEKMVIADNLGIVINDIYGMGPPYNGLNVLLAAYLYVLQLYCDFDGYSSIALGAGRLMGFDTMVNFNLPLFAVNIQDYWKRWHISLSSWVHDYLYVPLFFGLRVLSPTLRLYSVLMATMIILGLWHGAAWNFFLFGAYQGLCLIVFHRAGPLVDRFVRPRTTAARRLWRVARIAFMFQITAAGLLLFRAGSAGELRDALYAVVHEFTVDPDFSGYLLRALPFVAFTAVYQLFQYLKRDLFFITRQPWTVRALFCCLLVYFFLIFGVTGKGSFIYVHF